MNRASILVVASLSLLFPAAHAVTNDPLQSCRAGYQLIVEKKFADAVAPLHECIGMPNASIMTARGAEVHYLYIVALFKAAEYEKARVWIDSFGPLMKQHLDKKYVDALDEIESNIEMRKRLGSDAFANMNVVTTFNPGFSEPSETKNLDTIEAEAQTASGYPASDVSIPVTPSFPA